MHGLGGEEEDTDWLERPTRYIQAEGNNTNNFDPSYLDNNLNN